MTPQEWKEWINILRDLTLVTVGTFMLVYETIFVRPPSLNVLSIGAALLGIPMVVRLDLWSNNNGNGKGNVKSPPPEQERRHHRDRNSS